MISLKEFYYNFEKNYINESNMFDINYNDSGITKIIKKFLNWFLGSTEKETYNPYSKNWNEDATETKLKEYKSDGGKITIEFTDISSFEDFRSAINKSNYFLNFKQLFYDKSELKKCKTFKFAAVNCDAEKICDGLPVIYFIYKFEKNTVNIYAIEAVNGYTNSLNMKDFISKLKSFLKTKLKEEKKELNTYTIRITKMNSKAKWSFEKLFDFVSNDKSFTRNTDLEQDKTMERIYVGKL